MVRLKIYKVKKSIAKLLIGFGSIILVAGLIIVIKTVADDTTPEWSAIVFILQGILFLTLGYLHYTSDKYFIEWDDTHLNYLLPGSGKIETIQFPEIKSITINLFEIQLQIGNSEKTINLGNLQFEEIKALKQKFEELLTSIKNGSQAH